MRMSVYACKRFYTWQIDNFALFAKYSIYSSGKAKKAMDASSPTKRPATSRSPRRSRSRSRARSRSRCSRNAASCGRACSQPPQSSDVAACGHACSEPPQPYFYYCFEGAAFDVAVQVSDLSGKFT